MALCPLSDSSQISSRRVVVVDSEPASRERLVAFLKKEGFNALSAATALELYGLLSQEEFALAVIDDDFDDQHGLVVARFLKRNTSLPSIMLTSTVTHQARLAAYNAGALACFLNLWIMGSCPFLSKTFLNRELLNTAGALSRQQDFSWVAVNGKF